MVWYDTEIFQNFLKINPLEVTTKNIYFSISNRFKKKRLINLFRIKLTTLPVNTKVYAAMQCN